MPAGQRQDTRRTRQEEEAGVAAGGVSGSESAAWPGVAAAVGKWPHHRTSPSIIAPLWQVGLRGLRVAVSLRRPQYWLRRSSAAAVLSEPNGL